ncbi:MAG: hypothetical protein E6X17_06545 [Sporomusaceae bacterium]|nr:hypothetical protein [Sporomusaceae bacterium]
MKHWQSLTLSERDTLVADKIMAGKPAAYAVAETMADTGCNVTILVGPKGRCRMQLAGQPW